MDDEMRLINFISSIPEDANPYEATIRYLEVATTVSDSGLSLCHLTWR
jgi:hypothetical protein